MNVVEVLLEGIHRDHFRVVFLIQILLVSADPNSTKYRLNSRPTVINIDRYWPLLGRFGPIFYAASGDSWVGNLKTPEFLALYRCLRCC